MPIEEIKGKGKQFDNVITNDLDIGSIFEPIIWFFVTMFKTVFEVAAEMIKEGFGKR